MKFTKEIENFINSVEWTLAKSMPEWPHEYIVRKNVNDKYFQALVAYIRNHGYEASFYDYTYIYFEEKGLVYWTMGAPIEETIIINRCDKSSTYEVRLKEGTLP